MGERSHYLPRKSVLDAMSDHDRTMVLDVYLRELETSIAGLELGDATPFKGTVEDALEEARDQMHSLVALANSYGLWLDEVAS